MGYTSGAVNKVISYSDEFMECGLIGLILLSFFFKKVRLSRAEYRILYCYVIFALMGLLSNVVYPMQSWFLNLSDLLVCSRFLVFYYAVRILLPGYTDSRELLLSLTKACRVVAIVLFTLAIHDLLLDPIFPKRDFRYFMYSLQLCFPHPTYLAVTCVTCSCVLMAAMEYCQNTTEYKINFVCLALGLFITIFTLRSKAIAAVACIFLLYCLIIKWKVQSRALLLSGGGLLATIIGWDQMLFYFTTNVEEFVRARLLRDAVVLASSRFPLGTGFATFGSAIAATHYSTLYVKLGYNSLYGGSKNDPRYLCDTFWGTVIAQNGWIGTLAFLGIVIGLIVVVMNIPWKSKYLF